METKSWTQWRKDKGIMTVFITKKLGFSRQTLYNKESGKSQFSFREGLAYCKILGITPDQVED